MLIIVENPKKILTTGLYLAIFYLLPESLQTMLIAILVVTAVFMYLYHWFFR